MSAHVFDSVARIADAVLFEGYVLYPYRASATKNRYRWQFGIVAPAAPRGDADPSWAQTECLIRPACDGPPPCLRVRVRALRPRAARADTGLPWLHGHPVSLDVPVMWLGSSRPSAVTTLEIEDLEVRLTTEVDDRAPFFKVRLRVENLEPWRPAFEHDRDAMLQRSLVGTHLLMAVDGGAFESLLEPSAAARSLVQECRNLHTWPVLVGDRRHHQLMLSSPIVLYDYPAVAPETHGDLCDGAEIDEILTLRILTLTDEEKRDVRRTDPRARAILDRVESMSQAELGALHGTMRSADFFNPPDAPPAERAVVQVDGRLVARGSRVRLRPNRRADTMDLFLRGQPATVAGVYRDVDDRVYVAVTVDADPGASLHDSFGRFFYFDPSEIDPLPTEPL